MPAPGGGKQEEVSGVAPGTACAVTMTSFLKMLLLRERPVVFGVKGLKRCHMGLKSLLVIPDEPFSVLPLLLGWLYLPGYCALASRFCQVVIFLLAPVCSVSASLEGKVWISATSYQ